MKRLLVPGFLSLMFFANVARCPADVILSYTISDQTNNAGHQVSDTEASPIGTAVAGGIEYDFAFGALGNKNWNWRIGQSMVSLILYGPQDDPTGAKLFLSGATSNRPFTVTYNGPDRRFSNNVEIKFGAQFSPIAGPLSRTAGLYGDITSMNPRLSANPTMVPTTTGSGNFGPVNFDSTVGPVAEPMAVSSMQGDITFAWNQNLQVNGDTVTFSQAYVAVAPEPSSFVLAVCGGFFGLGVRLLRRRRLAV
jgi:hypothetical protein